MTTPYTPPAKPAKIDPGSFWATVAEIEISDGNGPHEKTWACEMIGYRSASDLARAAAVTWFEDTDQSSDCDLTIALEDCLGVVAVHRMRVGPKIVASEVRA